jgi:hypothetical protein
MVFFQGMLFGNRMSEEYKTAILKLLHPTQGSSLKWIQSKLKIEEEKLNILIKDLLKQGLISNGMCDDSACGSCGGSCDSLKNSELMMYTITKKGLESR